MTGEKTYYDILICNSIIRCSVIALCDDLNQHLGMHSIIIKTEDEVINLNLSW